MDITLLDRLLAVADLFQRDRDRAYDGTALSPARMHVLWVVHHEGPVTQQTLALRLAVTPRNISGLVDALESAGYLLRRAHPTDRRAHLVSLTDRGVALMRTTEDEHKELSSNLLDAVDPADRDSLQRGLEAVTARLRELMAEHAPTAEVRAS